MKALAEECCQTCDGEVFPGGSVISVREDGSECGSSVTTECVSYGNAHGNLASVNFTFVQGNGRPSIIEQKYSYKECCHDSKGNLKT